MAKVSPLFRFESELDEIKKGKKKKIFFIREKN